MDKDEQFVLNEVDFKTPKQSPQTWPMDKNRQNRYPQKMPSLLSPVTPKRNCSISNTKTLLLQCLRDSKSDPVPRRRFSDEGVLMDGVLVTSVSGKKVKESPSSSLGRSALSLVIKSQLKNAEFSTPRSKTACKQETTRSQHLSGGKENSLANSPSTKVETPKPANPSKLKASAKPFLLTPKSSPKIASPVPLLRVPYDHDPHFLWGSPRPQLPLSHAYPRPLHGPQLLLPPASPHGTNVFLPHYFNQSPARNGLRSSLPTTPFSGHKPPNNTPISTKSTANLSTSTTSHGSGLNLPTTLDEFDIVIEKLDLSPPSSGLEKRVKVPDLSSPSAELETVTQKPELTLSDELEAVALTLSAGLQTMMTMSDWSPSDDGLPIFTEAQSEFMKSQNRILPDDVFEHYKYRERLPCFTQLCLDEASST